MKKVEINCLDDLGIVMRVIRAQFDLKGKLDVVIKNQDESITEAQWGLYFVWCGIIGTELGNTKDEQHQYFKERYLLNIYISDLENHPEFDGVIENMNIVKKQCEEQFWPLRKLILSGVSIKHATKKNMMELLKEVDGMARGLSIRLPLPPRKGLM